MIKTRFITYWRIQLATSLLMLSALSSFANSSRSEGAQFWSMKYSSPNLCGRQSQEPAPSAFLYFDGFSSGRAAQRWAKHLKQDPRVTMSQVWADFHRRSFLISQAVFKGLTTGSLPIITQRDLSACNQANCDDLSQKVDHAVQNLIRQSDESADPQVSCLWIKKSLPQQMKTQVPNRRDLENIAMAYLDKNKFIDRCESLISRDSSHKADLILRYEVRNLKDWKDRGFEFWTSFKYYYSKAWSSTWNMPQVRYQDLLKSFAADEIVTIVAEGCYSISKPECSTDFLSQRQLSEALSTGQFSKTFLMAREMIKKETQDTEKTLSNPRSMSDENIETRQFLMSSMTMRQQASQSLLLSLKRLNALFAQYSPSQLVSLAQDELSLPDKVTLGETLCAEVHSFSNDNMSGFAKEVSKATDAVSQLQNLGLPGDRIDSLWSKTWEMISTIKPLCQQIERNLKERLAVGQISKNQVPPREWFKTITQYSLPFKFESAKPGSDSSSALVSLGSETICSTAADCIRTALESAVEIYHVSLYKNGLLPSFIREFKSKSHLAGSVACRLYDPWAATQAKKTKLIFDVLSSFLSGVARLPIYLDVNVPTPQVVSFQQMVENGNVVFDPIMKSSGLDLTLFVDLGILAKSPCYVSIANSTNIKNPNSVYAFRGVEMKYCATRGQNEAESDSLNMTKFKSEGVAGCGSCSINFDEVLMSTVQSDFIGMRFGLRLLASFINYFQEDNNPYQTPIEHEINPQYVAETYNKYNGIPDKCVYELVRGSKCMEDLCVSKTVVEYEKQTGYNVSQASLWTDVANPQSRSVWMKVQGCEKEIGIPVHCESNKSPGQVYISSAFKNLKCASRGGNL